MAKIAIIGAGAVGSLTACLLAEQEVGKIILLDIAQDLATGKALDINQGMALYGAASNITATSDYVHVKDADIVIVTAGSPRKPGMSRDDLVHVNKAILESIIPKIVEQAPHCILIIVTNPLDVMVQYANMLCNFPKQRIMGMSGALDSARFTYYIANKLEVPVSTIHAMVIGSHADTMVPLTSIATVNGKKLHDLLDKQDIEDIVQKTRQGGATIIALQKSSTMFAPAYAIAHMVESIIFDKKKTISCSVYLEGEYGLFDMFLGVPAVLGKEGVEEIVELPITSKEMEQLQTAAEHIKQMTREL